MSTQWCGKMTEEHPLDLIGAHSIETCPALIAEIAAHICPNGMVTVLADRFASGDITIVQALVAARKSAEAVGCGFEIGDPSPAFVALLERSGLAAV